MWSDWTLGPCFKVESDLDIFRDISLNEWCFCLHKQWGWELGCWVVVDTVTFMCLPLVHMYMLFFLSVRKKSKILEI